MAGRWHKFPCEVSMGMPELTREDVGIFAALMAWSDHSSLGAVLRFDEIGLRFITGKDTAASARRALGNLAESGMIQVDYGAESAETERKNAENRRKHRALRKVSATITILKYPDLLRNAPKPPEPSLRERDRERDRENEETVVEDSDLCVSSDSTNLPDSDPEDVGGSSRAGPKDFRLQAEPDPVDSLHPTTAMVRVAWDLGVRRAAVYVGSAAHRWKLNSSRIRQLKALLKDHAGEPAVFAQVVDGYWALHGGSSARRGEFDARKHFTADTLLRAQNREKYLDALGLKTQNSDLTQEELSDLARAQLSGSSDPRIPTPELWVDPLGQGPPRARAPAREAAVGKSPHEEKPTGGNPHMGESPRGVGKPLRGESPHGESPPRGESPTQGLDPGWVSPEQLAQAEADRGAVLAELRARRERRTGLRSAQDRAPGAPERPRGDVQESSGPAPPEDL